MITNAFRDFDNVGRHYNDFSQGFKTGWNFGTAPVRMASKGLHNIDHALQHLTGVPLLDDVLNLVTDEPLYAGAMAGVDSINSSLDDIGQLGSDVDNLIKRGFGFHYKDRSAQSQMPQHRAQAPPPHVPTLTRPARRTRPSLPPAGPIGLPGSGQPVNQRQKPPGSAFPVLATR